MMPQSLRSCQIAMRDGNERTLKYTLEPIVPSLYDCLRIKVANTSIAPIPSMRSSPLPGQLLKRLNTERNIRKKVRFAMFDSVHIFEPESSRKQDLWWSMNELNGHRSLERQSNLDKPQQVYLNAFNKAFRELSMVKTVSMPMKLKLVAGFASGFIGLESVASQEWMCTRRLDVRCIVASVVAVQHRTRRNPKYSAMDVANMVASHSQRLTRSHRVWSSIIGETNKIAVEIS